MNVKMDEWKKLYANNCLLLKIHKNDKITKRNITTYI